MYFLPIKENRIVFDNFGGKGYGDSTKYIAEELIKSGRNYELVWLVDNLSSYEFPKQIKTVKIDSIKALCMRATAKVWVDNVRHLHPVKRKRSKYIYRHGMLLSVLKKRKPMQKKNLEKSM